MTAPNTPPTPDPSTTQQRVATAAGARVLPPGGGVRLEAGGVQMSLLVTSDHGDRFSLIDYQVPPRFAAPPVLHHHTREDWAAYVLEGQLTFVLADGEVDAPAGTTVFVPAGTDFAWRNDQEHAARYLAVHAPAGFDRFFVDVAEVITDQRRGPAPDLMRHVLPSLWERYGIEPGGTRHGDR